MSIEDDELLDSQNQPSADDVNTDDTVEANTDSDNDLAERVARLEEQNKKLYTRAKTAEGELKEFKKPKTLTTKTNETLSREEAILIAKGMDEEDLEALATIANGAKIPIVEAQKNPLFTAYYETKQERKRNEQAKLSASKSAQTAKENSFTPSMDKSEHQKMWEKKVRGR